MAYEVGGIGQIKPVASGARMKEAVKMAGKKTKKIKTYFDGFVSHQDGEVPPELLRYNHENLKQPYLTFKDRRG